MKNKLMQKIMGLLFFLIALFGGLPLVLSFSLIVGYITFFKGTMDWFENKKTLRDSLEQAGFFDIVRGYYFKSLFNALRKSLK